MFVLVITSTPKLEAISPVPSVNPLSITRMLKERLKRS
ncbi:uncharacterized protein METZ01_LOCUS216192 [marine metagenome]|uniref:Uncharacterized protein n=1 Tax=marine metagenome TaxID=408172 RepID=A0A382FJT9_9ZZZZ